MGGSEKGDNEKFPERLSEEVTLQLQGADIASGEDQEGELRRWTETQCSGPGRTQGNGNQGHLEDTQKIVTHFRD
ncbi:hypothetical protein LEMLEM_LOCUS11046 [Lemmus lemmus]